MDQARGIGGRCYVVRSLVATVPGVEGGECSAVPVAGHTHALGLKVLQGEANVQDALHPGADHAHRRPPQLGQVGADVHALRGAPVHAPDAARDKHLDPGHVGGDHGPGHHGFSDTLHFCGKSVD